MNRLFLAGVVGAALTASLLFSMGALPDEIGTGAGDGVTVSCAEGAETCDVSLRMRADWLDQKGAEDLGAQPVRWISTVRVPSSKLQAVVSELVTGAGCTANDGKPSMAKTSVTLPPPCDPAGP